VAANESEVPALPGRDVRIDTFESEIDPLEFSLLDSGHFVLFRKVWRDRERFIQGMLIEREAFMRDAVDEYFDGSVTARMSDLLVAWEDDLIHSGNGDDPSRYASGGLQSPTPLLYRSRLSSPLDGLELIYRIRHLPPGPGASVLAWVTAVIAVVFCGGFVALYRLGASQIELARQQQDFVSAVSHELKTPLTSIRMYGEMLKEGWAEPGKRQQYYEYIHEESERLTRLIANVLQLASMSRSQPKLEIQSMQVGRLMQDIEDRIADQVRHAGFELRVDRDPHADAAKVEVDPDCFVQIVINLVDNAIKFSVRADTRAIELSSRAGPDGSIRFSVRDFGPGIPPNQMKKIFRLFYRAGNELTRETVGTGIGLAIVHELAHAMGGKVDVVNRNPGAEFTMAVPATL
jgi:signal transduction histidine kinase